MNALPDSPVLHCAFLVRVRAVLSNNSNMAAMWPREKEGCFRRLEEIKRREMSAVNCKRSGKVVEEV